MLELSEKGLRLFITEKWKCYFLLVSYRWRGRLQSLWSNIQMHPFKSLGQNDLDSGRILATTTDSWCRRTWLRSKLKLCMVCKLWKYHWKIFGSGQSTWMCSGKSAIAWRLIFVDCFHAIFCTLYSNNWRYRAGNRCPRWALWNVCRKRICSSIKHIYRWSVWLFFPTESGRWSIERHWWWGEAVLWL